ncbi:MAG: mechanosensitive ion channel family protein [Polyangiales bacterium]
MRRPSTSATLLHAIVTSALLLVATLCAPIAWAGPSDGLVRAEGAIDRATPRRSIEGFVGAAKSGDFTRAAHYLDLRDLKRGDQAREGASIAQHLAYVLDKELVLDATRVADTAEGTIAAPASSAIATQPAIVAGATTETIGTILLADEPVPITLARVRFDDGVQRWVVSRTTVALVPALYAAFGPSSLEERLPAILAKAHFFGLAAWQWVGMLLVAAMAWLAGHAVAKVSVAILHRLAKRTSSPWDDALVESALGPLRLVVAVQLLRLSIDPLRLSASIEFVAEHASFSLLVVGIAWFAIEAMKVGAQWVQTTMPSTRDANERQRGLRTQLDVLHRVASMVVVVVAASVILMQFEKVRSVGMSILASAGVLGIAVGFAAQKSLGAVIAGIQLSLTQPIRIGDVVVVEGENGTIEELHLTYIVVRIWDDRRLIVPISRFLDLPFQNWTKLGSDLLGTVTVTVDLTCPVDLVRAECKRLVAAHPKWDKRAWSLRVIESTERGMVLRALASAANADDVFELRCDLREQLVAFLQRLEDGLYLPRMRGDPGPHVKGTLADRALPSEPR